MIEICWLKLLSWNDTCFAREIRLEMISAKISEVYFRGIFHALNLGGRSQYANFRRRRYSRREITSAPRRAHNGGTAIKNSEVCALTARTSHIQTYSGIYYERKGLDSIVHTILRRMSRRYTIPDLLLTQVENCKIKLIDDSLFLSADDLLFLFAGSTSFVQI